MRKKDISNFEENCILDTHKITNMYIHCMECAAMIYGYKQ